MTEPEHFTDGRACWCELHVIHEQEGDIIVHHSLVDVCHRINVLNLTGWHRLLIRLHEWEWLELAETEARKIQ